MPSTASGSRLSLTKFSAIILSLSSMCLAQTLQPPVASKSFGAASIPINGTTTLTLSISNPNQGPLSVINLTDNFPAGITAPTPGGPYNCPGATGILSFNQSSLSYVNVTIPGGATCTVTQTIRGTTPGVKVNTTTAPTSNAGPGLPASATMEVIGGAPPTLTKAFGAPWVIVNDGTTLTFTLSNPNAALVLTNISFTDTLPAGLAVATPNGLSGSCGGGTITAVAGSNSVSLSGATLAGGASCTFRVNVIGKVLGVQANTTSQVTSAESLPGAAASATIEVVADAYRISYMSNLNAGDSVLNLTNTGENAVGTGTICVNVYVFAPDEQMVSCCSCPVTPNGLVSLSGQRDLVSNTMTPSVPTSIVVKLLATVPAGGNCLNSAAEVMTTTRAPGMEAWSTTLHAKPAGGYAVVENTFRSATLSPGERARLGTLCTFITANGSGYGICRSCRTGGLGAGRE